MGTIPNKFCDYTMVGNQCILKSPADPGPLSWPCLPPFPSRLGVISVPPSCPLGCCVMARITVSCVDLQTRFNYPLFNQKLNYFFVLIRELVMEAVSKTFAACLCYVSPHIDQEMGVESSLPSKAFSLLLILTLPCACINFPSVLIPLSVRMRERNVAEKNWNNFGNKNCFGWNCLFLTDMHALKACVAWQAGCKRRDLVYRLMFPACTVKQKECMCFHGYCLQ